MANIFCLGLICNTPSCFLDYMIAQQIAELNYTLCGKHILFFHNKCKNGARFNSGHRDLLFAFDLIVFFYVDFLVCEHLLNPELQGFNRD